MKKTNLFVAALLGSALTLSSCSSEENVVKEDSNLAQMGVEVGISGNVDSRSGITASAFANNETLGLYIYRNDMTVKDAVADQYNFAEMIGTANPTVNVPYAQTGAAWIASQPIILSNIQGFVYAYYPYSELNVGNDGRSIPITVSPNQETGQSDGSKDANGQIDYMWATPKTGISNLKPKVNLSMNHALAKVSFTFKHAEDKEKYPGAGLISDIILRGVKTGKATLNITNGAISEPETAMGTILLTGMNQGENGTLIEETSAALVPSLLLYPQTLSGSQVTVKIDGVDYTVDIPASMTIFEAGKHYTMQFTVKGTALVVNQVSIQQWQDGGSDKGEDVSNPDNQDTEPA